MTSELVLSLLALIAQANADVVSSHVLSPRVNRTHYETACGTTSIRIAFENNLDRNQTAVVLSVEVEGMEVPGAAQRLTNLAVDRIIERVGITNCGYDERAPVITGTMSAFGRQRLAPTLSSPSEKRQARGCSATTASAP